MTAIRTRRPRDAGLAVAAIWPASDLPGLAAGADEKPFGKILSAYLIAACHDAYADADTSGHVDWRYRPLVRDMATRCIEPPEIFFSIAEARLVPDGGLFVTSPTEGPFGERLRENMPSGPFAMPVLIGQGRNDELVLLPVQDRFAGQLCDDGQPVDYRTYAGRDHLSVVAPDSPLTADLIGWTAARFRGEPAGSTCGK